ncbi:MULTISPECIES: HlyC/CorC family transporter [Chromohalobacter]|uniref:Magnesium and cobalt efflux protein CorC n=1 Tax=Chromohalobacter israelensis (strain ATCC BAA-138 / DSM 3043 / CIP 106854 / NCIMB 13768 / 1H11) TaxID=290398 RepID=Q1QV21_CHRI1|nr:MULTISPECIES: transporter associated domain-containing protein [Chromohalobacter]ABE59687.1 putative metal ion transporter [Chromohalobacter salexigens DSM 3043]MBZ5874578.1 CBS domain-containing protein [Chromohalobacter salexigens]MDF9433379.1 CBS domain-containing protein [Chromohalobacter israelensis]MDO0947068.1 transporter associated domain-containing protein [Chromohalobacter salexigens]NWO57078.1 CBS domain-containing protein [Chromohalobacter salexigens]
MSEDRSSSQGGKSWLDKLLSAFSNDADEPSSRDELLTFLREAGTRLRLDQDALTIIEGAFQISDQQTREVMIPRSQVTALHVDQRPEDCLPVILETAHSRYPVIDENLDEVLGIVLVKDLLPLLKLSDAERQRFQLRDILRPAMFIPESKRLNSLLKEFRDTHNHMAVVVDEYGGTAGIVTIEDILEQIVGDIEDEHDTDEEDDIRDLGDGTYAIRALTPIEEFNERFDTAFPDEEFDTVGGLVMQRFGHLPRRNEYADLGDWRFTVLNADNRRIRLLQVSPASDASSETAQAERE